MHFLSKSALRLAFGSGDRTRVLLTWDRARVADPNSIPGTLVSQRWNYSSLIVPAKMMACSQQRYRQVNMLMPSGSKVQTRQLSIISLDGVHVLIFGCSFISHLTRTRLLLWIWILCRYFMYAAQFVILPNAYSQLVLVNQISKPKNKSMTIQQV